MLTFEGRTGPDQDDPPTYPAPTVADWWRDAKLGVFVHWGIYSLPAFACPPGPRVNEAEAYARHTYAEWYANTVRIPGSPTARRHAERFGEATYEDLAGAWRAESFDAETLMADVARWGARYVIPTTKHHDGFCLWDSATTTYSAARRGPRRDLIAEMHQAAGAHGLRFGCYFSGALDWHVSDLPAIQSDEELFAYRRNDTAFARYAAAQLRELIDRFAPAVLWNDIEWPDAGKGRGADDLAALFAEYQTVVPDGVLNDRWGVPFHGHLTREYLEIPGIVCQPWEATRGIGHSFGYNAEERPEQRLDGPTLVRLLVDVVAKGGNLLINVGPTAAGVVPTEQHETMDALGEWLSAHGEAVYGSRPWVRHGEPDGSLAYTVGPDRALFVHVMHPGRGTVALPEDVAGMTGLDDAAGAGAVTWLGPHGVGVGAAGRELTVPAGLRHQPVAVARVGVAS